jgi:recombination protein RecT
MSTQLTETQDAKTFPGMLMQFKKEIAAALPKHLNPDRMARIALTAFRRTPKLGDCDPKSVFAAVIQASQLGLEPDTLGRSYLIPYGRECQFVPGWKGLVDLTNRAGNATTWTGAVHEGDEFDYALGDRPFVSHKPGEESDEEQLTHVYAVGRVKGGEWPIIEVWTIGKVRRHRDKYNKVGKRHYSFENFEMYARKVVLLQVLKYMPASSEMASAIALNDAAEIGKQGLTVKDVIEGTWAPVPDTGEKGEEKTMPFLSAEDFEKKKSGWKKLIQEGKKTPSEIIATAETKERLTDDQKHEIDSWGRENE